MESNEHFLAEVGRRFYCQDFARQLGLHLAIIECQSIKPNSFLSLCADNAIHTAIIDWCILFGPQSSHLHWKNISDFDIGKFRRGILEVAGMTEEEWSSYQKSVMTVRNKQAAHADIKYLNFIIPELDTALKTIDYLFDQLKDNNPTTSKQSQLWRPSVMECFQATFDETKIIIATIKKSTNLLSD